MPEKTETKPRKNHTYYLNTALMQRVAVAADSVRWSASVWLEEAAREKLERENREFEGGP